MGTLKRIIAKWCRKADAIIDRILAGETTQMSLNLGPAETETPARYLQIAAPCDDEADDDDEPTQEQANDMAKAIESMTSTTSASFRARPFEDFHAPEIPRFSRPSLDPNESPGRIVADGRAARARMLRTLRVPREDRLAGYIAAQSWIQAERGAYVAKKGKAKAKGAAA